MRSPSRPRPSEGRFFGQVRPLWGETPPRALRAARTWAAIASCAVGSAPDGATRAIMRGSGTTYVDQWAKRPCDTCSEPVEAVARCLLGQYLDLGDPGANRAGSIATGTSCAWHPSTNVEQREGARDRFSLASLFSGGCQVSVATHQRLDPPLDVPGHPREADDSRPRTIPL